MSEVANFTYAPSLDGKVSSFPIYEEKVIPLHRISTLGTRTRAANALLHMADIARKLCMAVGKGHLGNDGGAR